MPIAEVKTDATQQALFPDTFPGALDIDTSVRALVADAIRRSSKSREQIADDMSYLTGRSVTKTMLDCYTAESKEHRFPVVFLPAFCKSTGDCRLLDLLSQHLGLSMITPRESQLLDVARALENKRRADEQFDTAARFAFGGAR